MARPKVKLSGATLKNNKGKDVPVELIKPEILRKHHIVEKVMVDAVELNQKMEKAKIKIMKAIKGYEKYFLKINQIKEKENTLQNLTLANFSNTARIVVRDQGIIEFDEHLQLAIQKIKDYAKRAGKDAPPALYQLVENMLKVDKKGFVNKHMILGLLSWNVKGKDWADAMELIRKSIKTNERKEYVLIQFRQDQDSPWVNVNLNFSSLEYESGGEA